MAVEIPDVSHWLAPPDLPEVPNVGWRAQWNAIVDFWSDPCEAPFTVYFRLALPILGSMLALLLTPSPAEIVETLVQPRRYTGCWRNRREHRSRRHRTVRPRTGRPFRLGIPDVDSLIAEMIPGREAFQMRQVGASASAFWVIWQQLDRRMFQLMFIDLLGNGFYAWHSALLNTEWCSESSKQVAKTWDTEWPQGLVEEMMIVPQIGPKYARNGGDAGLDGIQMTRNTWRALFVADVTCISGTAAEGTLFMLNGANEVVRTFPFSVGPGSTTNFTQTVTMRGAGAIRMGLIVTAGTVLIHNTMLWGEQLPG